MKHNVGDVFLLDDFREYMIWNILENANTYCVLPLQHHLKFANWCYLSEKDLQSKIIKCIKWEINHEQKYWDWVYQKGYFKD